MSSRFDVIETGLTGLCSVVRKPIGDQRGFFSRFFCSEELAEVGFGKPVAQINQSFTKEVGTVRGMHFQYPPHAEIKFVSCLQGEIFDVAVDVRAGSPTFLKWHGQVLSAKNHTSLLIPEGFAHGFQTLTEDCELMYVHAAPYAPQAQGGLHPCDPMIDIHWPLAVRELSEQDQKRPLIGPAFKGMTP